MPYSEGAVRGGEQRKENSYGDQWALAKCVDPILVPQQTEQFGVQAGLEDLHLQRIVLICVDSKVLDLIERDALVFRCRRIGGRITRRIGAKGPDVYASGRDRAVGVDLHDMPSGSHQIGQGNSGARRRRRMDR